MTCGQAFGAGHFTSRPPRFAFHIAALLLVAHATVAVAALPHNIPDFGTDPSRTTVRSVQSGNWSSASTWSSGLVPTANQVVHVDPGHVVTIDTTGAVAYTVAVHGTLRFNPSVNTRLKVTNLMVMGDHGMPGMTSVGYLEVGTAATPIASTVTAEIIIANTALGGGVSDPEQFGTGLLNFGKLTMHGAPMTPTWTRVAVEPLAGHTSFTLSEAVAGWRVGDRLVIPDTRHIKESEVISNNPWLNAQNQWEERTISALSADNRTVTLSSALQFAHRGARDHNGVLDFLPHVGNLTRNVIVRSESATGTRGHVISVHIADSDIRYVLFKDLGRTRYTPLNTTTNAIGRYPIHMHHNRGPLPTPANGYQFTLVGSAVDGGSVETQFKWGIAIHNSHYGLIKDNVVYNYNGASIATEDGSESFNVFDHNFALRGMGEPDNAVSEARLAMGTEAVGFWFRGPNNYVRNNVAANFQNPVPDAAYGYVFQFHSLGNIAVPNFKGADTSVGGQFTTQNGNNLPIRQFENNEAYGAMQGGLTYWWVSSRDPQPYATGQESLFKDLKLWHIYNKTIFHYPSQKITYDGLKIRGSYTSASRCCGGGVHFPDYSAKDIIIRNSDIQGVRTGINAPVSGFGPGPNLLVENSYLRNQQNVKVATNWSVNGCWMDNKLVEIRNTQFVAPPGQSLSIISMARADGNGIECLSKLNEVRVYAYNGVATDNFQVYHSNPAVLPRPPGSCTPTTRPGIDSGVTCPIAPQGATLPTATLTALPLTIAPGQSATLSWNTSNATSVSINQGIGTVAASGTRSVSPATTTTYTLTATNAAGSVTATAIVTVLALPTALLSASPLSIVSGQPSTLTWTTSGATTVNINQGIGTVATSGTRSVSPTSTRTYTLTASNAAGSTTATATVTIIVVPTVTMSASPTSIEPWQSSTLTWSTTNATSVSINEGIGSVATSGTRSVSPDSTTIYTVTATNAAGSTTASVTLTVEGPACRTVGGDFDGDRRSDVSVFRPGTGGWFTLHSASNYTTSTLTTWGIAGDIPVPGDYDCDGRIDLAVYRPSTSVWYVLQSSSNNTAFVTYQFGANGDVPVPGDYDGDGMSDPAVYRPAAGQWLVLKSSSNYQTAATYNWGAANTDVPVGGDYDGDGKHDLAVYRPWSGTWWIMQSSTGFATFLQWTWGLSLDPIVLGDYDGDGKADPAVFRASSRTWYILKSSTNYTTYWTHQWGLSTDTLVPADYDGDGRIDPAIYRPSTGEWFVLQSTTNYTTYATHTWGMSADIPINKRP